MSSLLETTDTPEYWRKVLSLYHHVLQLKADKMKPEKKNDLLQLDSWFQTELPKLIEERQEKYITKAELCKLMKWKLTRGKFRPRLIAMVAENSDDLVEKSSKAAFSKLPDVIEAINCLTVLKAVGPATASAILAAGCPEAAPFMADESMLAIPGLKPLAYTLGFYRSYLSEVKKIKKALNKADENKDWTAKKVEITLWTHYLGEQLSPGLFDKTSTNATEMDNHSKKVTKDSDSKAKTSRGSEKDCGVTQEEQPKQKVSRKRKRETKH